MASSARRAQVCVTRTLGHPSTGLDAEGPAGRIEAWFLTSPLESHVCLGGAGSERPGANRKERQ